VGIALSLAVCWASTEAWALEKYGRPLPSLEEGKEPEHEPGDAQESEPEASWVHGYLLTADFVRNPTFAARPDNSGLVGLRHMVHLETDLYKQYLTFYTDQNVLSDRTNGGIKLSEWDMTYALTGLLGHVGWRVQYERDAPLDRSGLKQIYGDALITYRFQAQEWSWWQRLLPAQNITGYAGPGWLFHNVSYFARPDNTGRALFRYVAHADLDLYRNWAVLFVDANLFTDRENRSKVKPTELDLIVGLALRWKDYEISIYQEADQPLDRPGLVQKYTAVQFRVAFDWFKRRG
jgi:hypothetical protein